MISQIGGRGIEVEYSASIFVRPPKRCEFVRTKRTIVRAKARHCFEPIRRPAGFLNGIQMTGAMGAHTLVELRPSTKSNASGFGPDRASPCTRVHVERRFSCRRAPSRDITNRSHDEPRPRSHSSIQNSRATEKYAGRAADRKKSSRSHQGIALQGRTSYSKP